MIKIVPDEEFKKKKGEVMESLSKSIEIGEESHDYDSNKINWDFSLKNYNWKSTKDKTLDLILRSDNRLFFLAHSKDNIVGKPQLIENTKKRIVLLRKVKNIKRRRGFTDAEVISYKFIGDLYDKRYDGVEIEILAFDFWVYRIISEDSREYYILSEQQLPNETCSINGMLIQLDDSTEINKNMKLKSLSNIFILKDFEPAVKIISKKELIKFTKKRKINEHGWINFLNTHPNKSINRFPETTEKLRSAFILSGKVDGYPLHLGVVGRAGTKKSMGWIETLDYKFSEEPNICEGGNSRIKGLSPSFKEKPANIGFLAKANRMAFVDEIGKMVELEIKKHQEQTGNYLGDLNFLCEHKSRIVGSGNDNECKVQATAKFLFVSNPISKKSTIHKQIGSIDPTFMSRILWTVQDDEETNFLLSSDSVIPPTHTQDMTPNCNPPNTYTTGIKVNTTTTTTKNRYEKSLGGLYVCWGEIMDRNEFLTIFDTCYSFICDMDIKKIQEIADFSVDIAQEPMKSSVWKPRALHHIRLLIDGLCKHRCLFKDYDCKFIAKNEDYEEAKVIITKIVNSWNTSFNYGF